MIQIEWTLNSSKNCSRVHIKMKYAVVIESPKIKITNENVVSKNVSALKEKKHNGNNTKELEPIVQTIFWRILILFSFLAFGCSNFKDPRMRNNLIPIKSSIIRTTWFRCIFFDDFYKQNNVLWTDFLKI